MKKEYSRLIEKYLADLMQEIPAVAIEGLKGIGKSVSATRLAKTVFELDQQRDKTLIENDMNILSKEELPVLIDEWQKLPAVWDYVRRRVDDYGVPGSFILTGSAKNTNLDIHSGAGRILRLRMYPLSLEERDIESPTISLASLLDQEKPYSANIQGTTNVSFNDYMEEILASGLPAIRNYSPLRRRKMLATYIEYLLLHEFSQQGIRIRQPRTLMRWLTAYAAATSSDTGYGEILDASTTGEAEKPTAKTTSAYREALERLWLIDELPVWLHGEDYFSRLKTAPKHYLADPALTALLLNFDIDTLTKSNKGRIPARTAFDEMKGGITGRLFESLIHMSLATYSVVNDASLSYIKTRNGDHEIDFIIQRGNAIVAIEVKMSQEIKGDDVQHLIWLKNKLKDDLTDALVLYTGPVAYRRNDDVAVIPAALFGA
ncbi:MAG: DUF4143 domain-containing protein [Oscillospiraceae bacterium]|nr:DUF4143 domain-containing protein [Oscillospiraceae bacterium]